MCGRSGELQIKEPRFDSEGDLSRGFGCGLLFSDFFFFEANPLAGLILNCMPLVLLQEQGKMVSLNVIKKTVLHFAS